MITKIEKNLGIEDYFNLTYRVTNVCNYHCPYCMQGNDKPKKDTTPELIQIISKKINEVIKELHSYGKKIDFHLIGGEVSIYDIKNLILKNIDFYNIYRFSMVTNLSRDVEYYKDLFSYLKNQKVDIRIKASFHPTETTKEEFINKLIELKEFKVIASLLITEKKYYNIEEMYNELTKLEIPVSVSVERINGEPITTNSNLIDKDKCLFHVTYDNGKTELLEKYTLLKSLDSVKGFVCDVDKNRIIIDNNGSIKKVCSQQRNLGSIFNFKYKPKEIICNSDKMCTLYAINRIYKNEIKNI